MRGGVIAIPLFDLMSLNIELRVCARLWNNVHHVWPSTTYRAWIMAFLFLIRYVTLWPWPLTSWPWTFTALDDLARFRRAILGVWHFCPTVLRCAWTQLFQTWLEHWAIISTQEIHFSVRTSSCIFKHELLKIERCWKRHQISHFLTNCEKLGEGWAISLCQLLKHYIRPNVRNTSDGHTLRGCWGRWIDKKEEKFRESNSRPKTQKQRHTGHEINITLNRF